MIGETAHRPCHANKGHCTPALRLRTPTSTGRCAVRARRRDDRARRSARLPGRANAPRRGGGRWQTPRTHFGGDETMNGHCGMLKARHVLFGFALLVAIVADSQGQSQQPSSEQEAAAKHQEELSKAATDKKIADFTELLFDATAALAGIAVLQLFVFGWQGKQLKRTVEHLVISERAHVSGGANHATTGDGRKVLIVTINNYGKTQAFIGNVAATICKKEELTDFPGWEVNEWKGYVFGPAPNQRSDIVFEYEAGKVIVGRIWYRDVFKKCYSVGFVLNTDDLTAVGDHESYWEEREEKNIRPKS
jgi:hypothetical protein